MTKIAQVPNGFADEEQDDSSYVALTAAQAQDLRLRQPSISPWSVVAAQCLAGVVVTLITWAVAGKAAAWSAGYGALAVVIPAVLFARGLMSQFSSFNAATASFGFFVWQAVKLAVSVAMIIAAPRLLVSLSWPALLVGLLVTLKVYWLALRWRPRPKQN
ncbi:MAG: ATP synthase subunit I [Burkholderiales bacterium]|nr:ATP synthase subunit I [Burkholderiales bacterium]